MYSRFGDDFTFVACEPMELAREEMGWAVKDRYPYELKIYESTENYQKAMRLSIESDVMIIGSAPEIYVSERIKTNKLIFRYSERIYKRGLLYAFSPRGLYYMITHHTKYRKKNVYMLCASAYTASDFSLVGAYKHKTYKWGYFPKINEYDIQGLIHKKKSDTINILWVGRFIDWKHPEKAILVAEKLKQDNVKFKLRMIGHGNMFEQMQKMANDKGLESYIEFLGSMTPDEVRKQMEQANIFLFTSDYNEGWGAVLNESMNSGCAVVASHAIGSVPFLIEHGVNGLVYKNSDINDLYSQVKKLVDNNELVSFLGENAYKSLIDIWNAKIAVKNFIELYEALLNNENTNIEIGPCSIAKPIMQRKMYKNCVR